MVDVEVKQVSTAILLFLQVTGLRLTKSTEERVVTADAYVAALDVPGAKRLLPQAWRRYPQFDNVFELVRDGDLWSHCDTCKFTAVAVQATLLL